VQFEWHFTVRGPPDTAFEGGYYHGRLSFPTEYPMKPPSIILLTPNGRFTTNKKICLSISGYHPETWQPSWSVRTALLALIAFMPTKSNRAIGSLEFSDAERRKLAEKSRSWSCKTCGPIRDLLKHPDEPNDDVRNSQSVASTSGHRESSDSDCVATNSKDCLQSSSSPVISGNDPSGSEYPQDASQGTTAAIKPETESKISSEIQSRLGADEQDRNSSDDDKTVPRLATGNSGTERDESQESNSEQQTGLNGSYTPACDGSRSNVTPLEIQDNRRAYPTLVYASIFILLFILILRRIVMVVQS